MSDTRKTLVFDEEIYHWIKKIQKKEGFNFSQTINWTLRKAMSESADD